MLVFKVSVQGFVVLSTLVISKYRVRPRAVTVSFSSKARSCAPLMHGVLTRRPTNRIAVQFKTKAFSFCPRRTTNDCLYISGGSGNCGHYTFLLRRVQHMQVRKTKRGARLEFRNTVIPFHITQYRRVIFRTFAVSYSTSFVFRNLIINGSPHARDVALHPLSPRHFRVQDKRP